jgi:hypothetical protein
MAVRGAAGAGKSVFASTLADAGLGRLCYFDVERKARLLPGSDGSRFDAIEIETPDELPEFIEWALHGEGKEQNYGCYVLDSWAMYFGRKHRDTVQAVRQRTNDPTALPSADELAADQMVFQEVLRRLCIDSGVCVVITDQIAAKGREDREENEMGRVLPMTSGGLEYFVDVMAELNVRVEDFRQVRVMRIIKTNSPAFPVGMEFVNPTFGDFVRRLNEHQDASSGGPAAPPPPPEVPPVLEVKPDPAQKPAGPTLDDLLAKANQYNLKVSDIVTAAKYYHNQPELSRLAPDQVSDLYKRLVSRMEAAAAPAATPAAAPAAAPVANGTSNSTPNGATNGSPETHDGGDSARANRRRA